MNASFCIACPCQVVSAIPDCSSDVWLSDCIDELPDNALDCFGREKRAEYRDDMSGVGSFSKQNLTLYVGKISDGARKEDTEETVRRHFGEWGEIARSESFGTWNRELSAKLCSFAVNILHNRGVAFVTYYTEHQAQFAKEAMSNQSLDGDETINVRWATDDPNPVTKINERKRLKALGEEGVADALERNRLAIEAVGGVVDEDEAELDRAYAALEEQEEQQPTKKARLGDGGIIQGDALENIKFYADLARKQAQRPKATSGLGALGGYGSDSD